VIKKRTGTHERSIRELRFENGGITIGEPIEDFIGVLSGSLRLTSDGDGSQHRSTAQPRQ
jgi:circadian clock protein KaiC